MQVVDRVIEFCSRSSGPAATTRLVNQVPMYIAGNATGILAVWTKIQVEYKTSSTLGMNVRGKPAIVNKCENAI